MSASPTPPHHPPTRQHRLRNVLFAGLLIVVPAYLTVRVLWLLFVFMDGAFAPVIDRAIGAFINERQVHIPGLGLVLTLLTLLFLGWLSTNVLGRRVIAGVENLIRRIPVAKSLYGGTKGVLEAVSRDQADAFKRVVLVEFPRRGLYAIGFVTNSPLHWPTPESAETTELLPVFIPKTPNPTGGFLLMVPPGEVIDCPMSVEDGIRMIVSGGILQPEAVVPQQLQPAALRPEPAGPVPASPSLDVT